MQETNKKEDSVVSCRPEEDGVGWVETRASSVAVPVGGGGGMKQKPP